MYEVLSCMRVEVTKVTNEHVELQEWDKNFMRDIYLLLQSTNY